MCDPGFTGAAGGPCAACELGKYKDTQGSAACADCGSAAFWPVGADPAVFACEACPTYSTRSSDLGSGVLGCICNLGYRRTTDTTCALCPGGYYCPEQHTQKAADLVLLPLRRWRDHIRVSRRRVSSRVPGPRTSSSLFEVHSSRHPTRRRRCLWRWWRGGGMVEIGVGEHDAYVCA
jgi:hypothetical protein